MRRLIRHEIHRIFRTWVVKFDKVPIAKGSDHFFTKDFIQTSAIHVEAIITYSCGFQGQTDLRNQPLPLDHVREILLAVEVIYQPNEGNFLTK